MIKNIIIAMLIIVALILQGEATREKEDYQRTLAELKETRTSLCQIMALHYKINWKDIVSGEYNPFSNSCDIVFKNGTKKDSNELAHSI